MNLRICAAVGRKPEITAVKSAADLPPAISLDCDTVLRESIVFGAVATAFRHYSKRYSRQGGAASWTPVLVGDRHRRGFAHCGAFGMEVKMPWRALIVGSVGPVAAGVVRAWTGAGNEVAGFWHASSAGFVRRDRRLAWQVPRWSVAASGRRHRFPIRQVPRLATWPQAAAAAEATGADVLISAYFRYLVPGQVLDIFGPRAVNFHPAPLPRYRGPNPIVAMVLDRSILTDGTMTLHILNEAFDEGPIVASEPVALSSDLNVGRYHLALAQAAARLTAGALQRYLAGEIAPVPQDGRQATYARPPAGSCDLRPEMTADEIRWRCRTLARRRPVGIAGIEPIVATGFRGIAGPPKGEPPTVGRLSVEFDAADARVSVWRKWPMMSEVRRLQRLVDLARTPVS